MRRDAKAIEAETRERLQKDALVLARAAHKLIRSQRLLVAAKSRLHRGKKR